MGEAKKGRTGSKTKEPKYTHHMIDELQLFEVFAGSDRFYVAAPGFTEGHLAVWHKLGAKTSDDLPKPFEFRRVNPDTVFVADKITKPKIKRRESY